MPLVGVGTKEGSTVMLLVFPGWVVGERKDSEVVA